MSAMIPCVRCGCPNSRTSSVCNKCGARLPRMEMASPETLVPVEALHEKYREFEQWAEKALHQTCEYEEFQAFLEEAQQNLKQPRKAFVYSETGEAQELDSHDHQHFAHFEKGLQVMWAWLEDGDPYHLEQGLEIMRQGNEKLLGASLITEAVPGAVTDVVPVTCVLCSFSNPPGNVVCDQCGAKLPRNLDQAAVDVKQPKVTDRYDRFKAAADKVQSGEWVMDDFVRFLDEAERVLASKRDNYYETAKLQEYAPEQVALGKAGVQEYERGINEMWLYVEDQDGSHLKRALEMMWEGNEKLNQAMAMNRALRKELTDQFGYL